MYHYTPSIILRQVLYKKNMTCYNKWMKSPAKMLRQNKEVLKQQVELFKLIGEEDFLKLMLQKTDKNTAHIIKNIVKSEVKKSVQHKTESK